MTKISKFLCGCIIFLTHLNGSLDFSKKSASAATASNKRDKAIDRFAAPANSLARFKQDLEQIPKYRHFQRILWNHESDHSKPGTYIFGDADGSFARIVLAAIISGHIEISNEGLEILTRLLTLESDTLSRAIGTEGEEAFTKFQSNTQVYQEIESLLSKIKFRKTKNKLVFLGDILFDRLTNNLNASITLIEHLHQQGVYFIKGNHDYIDAMDQIWRGYGIARDKSKENRDEINRVIGKCFTLAHYDAEHRILYTHAALGHKTSGETSYCSVDLEALSGCHLETKINELADLITHENMRNSRPGTTYKYKPDQEKKYIPSDFLHIHGHQEHASALIDDHVHYLSREQVEGVICANARNREGYLPVMILLV